MKVEVVDLAACDGGQAYIIDDSLSDLMLRQIDDYRQSLPLDSKRPTVDRRFFVDDNPSKKGVNNDVDCSSAVATTSTREYFSASADDVDEDRPLAALLEKSILEALSHMTIEAPPPLSSCHVLSWMRFLEYNRPGQALEPHTDGTKTCENTGKISTHTMLLYLCDSLEGGETRLMRNKSTILKRIKPKKGRILLFPHKVWHQGAPVVSVPKICLRCEVCLQKK